MASTEESSWRNAIFTQLQFRNRSQTEYFQDLIAAHNRLFENVDTLRNENLHLSLQNEKLRTEAVASGSSTTGSNSASEARLTERIQFLEQKLLSQQEELTELHRRKGENAQQIIDLNIKLQEKEKLLSNKEISLADSAACISSLRAEIRMYQSSIRELENLNQTIRDEHQALQLAFASLEEKLRKLQEENRQLLDRLIHYKTKDAEKMNEENDNFLKKKHAKVQKELEEACKDVRAVNMDDVQEGLGPMFTSALPTKVTVKFDAHEGEVNAVKWGPDQHIVATGGADRKVQLWDISKGTFKSRGVLVGSNAAVMSVEFDCTGTLVLGASNDFASRVWSIADQRLRHTLTGHSGKVMAGKFLGEQTKVVTGSYDRTLKIWDLRSRACIGTKFAGSSCNDLVTVDGAGTTFISGHFDKTVRFWDIRSDYPTHDMCLQGKVTSLDLSRDSNYLISCVRDDTLKLIDLRMNQIILSFSCDDFKVGCDWSRATFSPDGQYVAVGSADGSVFIWGVATAKVETVLKDHGVGLFSRSAVTATSWNPFGTYLISVDRSKRAVVWGD
uniref:Autophagy-related protein 16 domain-containing protein n=1 Tax=Photinus pyralis TaxID=7054 RepID=A0A1Y1MTA0_PHOPY